jgi:hypothetical protein
MKRSRFTEEQIVYALRKLSLALRSAISADNTGANLLCVEEEICPSGRERTPAVAATGRGERSAKAMVADLSLDKYMYRRPYEKKSEARLSPSARPVVSSELLGELRAGLSSGSLVERPGIGKARPRIRQPSGSAFGIWPPIRPPADLGIAAT